jgi:hypothetical protein
LEADGGIFSAGVKSKHHSYKKAIDDKYRLCGQPNSFKNYCPALRTNQSIYRRIGREIELAEAIKKFDAVVPLTAGHGRTTE